MAVSKQPLKDPLIEEFERIEKIEHDTALIMGLLFKKTTLVSANEVLKRTQVKLAIVRLLTYWDEINGALPSHNFAHSINVLLFAVCSAIDGGIDSQSLTNIAIASLFHDADRRYGKSDSILHHMVGKTSYHIKDSTVRSVAVINDRMSIQLTKDELSTISNAILDPHNPLGRFVHAADAFELSNPLRNSAIAYENIIARRSGSNWAIRNYYGAMERKLKGLPNEERIKVMQANWALGDWAYDFSLREIKVSNAVKDKLGFCAARGIQTLLLEKNGTLPSVTSISPIFKLHSNSIRRMCMDSLVKKSSVELGRLRALLHEDAEYCHSINSLESRGKLNKRIH